jgi:hypothetical protein
MKTCYCVKCKAPFQMPDDYNRPILCEECDPAMNPPKTYADGIAQGRREAAEAAVALLRSLGPEEEWNEERLCKAILGTASDEKTDKGEI